MKSVLLFFNPPESTTSSGGFILLQLQLLGRSCAQYCSTHCPTDSGMSQGQGASLCTLRAQVIDGGGHLSVGIDCDMVQNSYQQITA
jgi:hypothetical protein